MKTQHTQFMLKLNYNILKQNALRTLPFKVVTQSFITDNNNSYFFTKYILIGDFSKFIENNELIISDKLIDILKNKIEDTYENAEGNTVSVKLLEIINYEEVVDKVTSKGLNILMQQFYYFKDPISSEEFLTRYHFDEQKLKFKIHNHLMEQVKEVFAGQFTE